VLCRRGASPSLASGGGERRRRSHGDGFQLKWKRTAPARSEECPLESRAWRNGKAGAKSLRKELRPTPSEFHYRPRQPEGFVAMRAARERATARGQRAAKYGSSIGDGGGCT
jgi:hypothetical protein